MERALAIFEKEFGPEYPVYTAAILGNLGRLIHEQG